MSLNKMMSAVTATLGLFDHFRLLQDITIIVSVCVTRGCSKQTVQMHSLFRVSSDNLCYMNPSLMYISNIYFYSGFSVIYGILIWQCWVNVQ